MGGKKLSLAIILTLSMNSWSQSAAWEIENEWNNNWERLYSEFVAALGESGCGGANKCINSAANPYRARNPDAIKKGVFSDCADLPYVLRSYFAFVNKLPFSYTNEIESISGGGDIRYSPKGNKPVNRRNIQEGDNVARILSDISSDISSGQFRMPPQLDVDNPNIFPDFYSPAIKPGSIRPGTNVYDPNGHVAVVWKVEKNGRIHLMDAHPDNSISRIVYGKKFVRARPSSGAGFKNWRPIKEEVAFPNKNLSDFSLVQYFGTHPDAKDWSKGKFYLNGEELDYYDYVRDVMAGGNLKYDPIEEVTSSLQALCNDIKDRANAVELAINAGINRKNHPANLPNNIYGTEGEWESFSSPSRDARLKTAFVETRENMARFVKMADEHNPKLVFQGNGEDLKAALREIYNREALNCTIEYKSSNSPIKNVSLNLSQVEDRLFKLSFDPYHCIELRWGAEGSISCPDGQNKKEWYAAEQRLRNQIDRPYDVKMGFSLEQLQRKVPGSGIDNPPTYSLKQFLNL